MSWSLKSPGEPDAPALTPGRAQEEIGNSVNRSIQGKCGLARGAGLAGRPRHRSRSRSPALLHPPCRGSGDNAHDDDGTDGTDRLASPEPRLRGTESVKPLGEAEQNPLQTGTPRGGKEEANPSAFRRGRNSHPPPPRPSHGSMAPGGRMTAKGLEEGGQPQILHLYREQRSEVSDTRVGGAGEDWELLPETYHRDKIGSDCHGRGIRGGNVAEVPALGPTHSGGRLLLEESDACALRTLRVTAATTNSNKVQGQ